jgi:single-strand DNA-binding protein
MDEETQSKPERIPRQERQQLTMSAHNTITLMGRLTRDPEIKFTAAELAIASFTMAVDGRKKDDDATFVDCTAFGKTAEIIGQHFAKGKPILIVGSLRQERWENKEGEKRSKLTVVVDSFSFLPRNADEGAPSAPARQQVTSRDGRDGKTGPVTGGGAPTAPASEDEPPFS